MVVLVANGKGQNSIACQDGEVMKIMPTIRMNGNECSPVRENILICGPSGAGKSTVAADYIEMFNRIYPNSKVYVFSRLDTDDALDSLDIVRIPIDEELVMSPINIHKECPRDSLFLFDDCDTITDPKIRMAIMQLIKDILETGRHMNLYCIITSHLLTRRNNNENMTFYNELHRLVIFPRGGNKPAMARVLENHFGLEKQRIKKILGAKSRWLCFGKNYPQYLILDSGVQEL